MKRHLAFVLTLGVIAGLVWYLRPTARSPGSSPPRAASQPIDCVEAMFEAAARGDVAAYHACFTADAHERIAAQLRQTTVDEFSQALQGSLAGLKGRATLGADPAGADETLLTIERVYADRTDRQQLVVRQTPAGWRIASIGNVQAVQPAMRYGTPVWEAGDPNEH